MMSDEVFEWMHGKPTEHDWVKDFSHENGRYQNKCTTCKNLFFGHKRRVVCKSCSDLGWACRVCGSKECSPHQDWANSIDGGDRDPPIEYYSCDGCSVIFYSPYEFNRNKSPDSGKEEKEK